MRFVDSHLHLGGDSEGVIASARATQTILVSCGVDRRTSKAGLDLSLSHPGEVVSFVGVHPSEALKERDAGWVARVLSKAAGVGEVGLDPKYSATGPKSGQRKAFRAQLEAAEAASKPVQVHSRGAVRECVDVLGTYTLPSVLMHWFEDEQRLGEVVGRGYMVSFGPSLLYSKRLQRMASSCEPSSVLTETDYPVVFEPLGKAMGPSLIPSVVFRLSELWGRSFEETRAQTLANATRHLGLGEKG